MGNFFGKDIVETVRQNFQDINIVDASRRKVWDIYELLAEQENIDTLSAKNIVYLFENENTIPFICRYRRDLISQNITPEKLRDIKNAYTEILALRKKAETIVSQLEKETEINEEVRTEMLCAKSAEELEFLYAPYKPASKGSLADRAKALGLEEISDRLLFGDLPPVDLNMVVDRKNPDLDHFDKAFEGVCHIISHNFAKHTGILEELRRLQKVHNITLKCTKAKVVEPKESKEDSKSKSAAFTSSHGNRNDQSKYESYFKFENSIRYIKPHQVLAINRGEKSKFLTVKINIPDYFKHEIKRYIRNVFTCEQNYPLRNEVLEKAFEECYTKKLVPLVSRQIRSDLNESAKKASIDVFAKNLKQLLLMSPLKGERILGVDPGFTNGCKLALISETADVLETGVVYPHSKRNDPDQCGITLAKMLIRNKCKLIALGNGTACRETEFWLTKLFEKGILDPEYVKYSIVSEQGASIYSCSEVAKKEFPDLDVNVISAVSIARRLNDPLSEYVKIEPRHIGVGMYQHDINEKILSESLNEVVSECVSFVGVDINTASLSVLKHIAGLTEKRAEKIIQHRQENGPFRTRKDLLQVKTIGEKTFVQCAGFIRIEPKSLGGEVDNLLDCTWVHPESYTVAKKIISKCGLNLKNIGEPEFIFKIISFKNTQSDESLTKEFGIPIERLQVVLEALQRELFQDYRSDFDKKPLFKQGITRMEDLFVGEIVTGAVTNITHFGAFVDIGIECDGLIHSSKMNGIHLNLGDRVNTSVIDIDKNRRRIALRLDELI
ncbi:S1 RNA-binding domain-containing protein 1 isoform X2 [Episyrphus balteatus]|uniref:S1 RNA-binding domain-containing protein 1 isoform X2 n=1 Tax=Episyrphus balteatus TaxID=286459 RepID=UPI0024869782|nr:S1 RNA-binding domain-containing protein 1 isoform X2 [Episyrphus balteatus]